MKFILSELASMLNAQCYQVDNNQLIIDGCSIDTRTIKPNQAFLAFKGDQVDGHDFIQQAQAKNAAVAIVTQPRQIKFPQLVVQDIESALVTMAVFARKQFLGKVIGLTGSSGKTTTRQLIQHLLKDQFKVSSNLGNQNNELGVPLALCNLDQESAIFIAEMGARKKGDIFYLVDLVKPDVALVTNIGESHLAIFGSRQAIAETKTEIFSALDDEGIAVINLDDDFVELLKSRAHGKQIMSFSLADRTANCFIDQIQLMPESSAFNLHFNHHIYPCLLSVAGVHQVKNALSAMTTAIAVGADINRSVEQLSSFTGTSGRSFVCAGNWGGVLIDDAYNANPSSVKAAIDLLALYQSKRFLVLGDMLELGDEAVRLHEEVVQYALSKGIEQVYLFGEIASAVFIKETTQIQHFSNKLALLTQLQNVLQPDDVLLLKGSRSIAMDELLPSLVKGQR